jgi:hypothetical protein
MKTILTRYFILSLFFSLFTVGVFAQPVMGLKTIPGDYSSITIALSEIESNGMIGTVILELQNSYTSSGEVFPIEFSSNIVTSSIDNIIIRPAANVTNDLSITSSSLTTIKFYNGGKFITFDGRPGGMGSNKKLSLINTNVLGVAISFQENCSNDTVRYCRIKGCTESPLKGVISLLDPQTYYGTQNLLFEENDISNSIGKPNFLFLSFEASNIIVRNNKFYNHDVTAAGESSSAIFITSGSNWTIIGNEFYSEDTVSGSGSGSGFNSYYEIYVNAVTGVIKNNIFGPKSGGGNTAININGSVRIIQAFGVGISVDSNRIKNLYVTSNAVILIVANHAKYNKIGGVDSADQVVLDINSSAFGSNFGTSHLFFSGEGCDFNCVRNIKVNGNSSDLFIGFNGTAKANIVEDIAIFKPGEFLCFLSFHADSNILRNIHSHSTSLDSKLIGISGVKLTNNKITNLSTRSMIPMGTGFALTGVLVDANVWNNNQCIDNQIADLMATSSPSVSSQICGINIQLSGNASYHNIEMNAISNLMMKAASNSRIIGINIGGGNCNISNNTIALGMDTLGNGLDSSYQYWGINKSNTDKINLLFNSISVIGSNVNQSTSYSTCLRRMGSSADSIYNNIFSNKRISLSPSTSKSYCVYNSSASFLKSDHNVYNYDTSSLNSYLGQFGVTAATRIAQLKTISLDSNSLLTNPLFTTPTGKDDQINLRPANTSPIESSGLAISSVIFDKDFKTRLNQTATDIGAYSINANSVNTPSFTISVTPLSVSSISIGIGAGSLNAKVVFVSTSPTLTSFPQNCVSYIPNSTWKQGDLLDSVTSCVYDGTGSSIVVTGLTPNITYYVYAVEYLTSNSFNAYVMPIVSANGTTLPVKLTQFITSLQGKSVLNQWHTASEINNDYFELQRSIDGQQWSVIGKVKGHGTVNLMNKYELLDDMIPSQDVKYLYYRLKQVDFDGAFDYSKINSISFQAKPIIAQISPNPFQDLASIVIQSETEGYIDIVITNLSGMTLSNQRAVVGSGQNTIQINAIETLPHGMYFVSITQGSQILVLKMIH